MWGLRVHLGARSHHTLFPGLVVGSGGGRTTRANQRHATHLNNTGDLACDVPHGFARDDAPAPAGALDQTGGWSPLVAQYRLRPGASGVRRVGDRAARCSHRAAAPRNSARPTQTRRRFGGGGPRRQGSPASAGPTSCSAIALLRSIADADTDQPSTGSMCRFSRLQPSAESPHPCA